MRLLIIRHGQSRYNIGEDDNLDSDITKKGFKQTNITVHQLQRHFSDLAYWRGYVSPFLRTLQTAKIFHSQAYVSFKIDERIMEVGNYLMHKPDSLYDENINVHIPNRKYLFPDFFKDYDESYRHKYEDEEQILDRLENFLNYLIEKDEDAIVISHGTPCHVLYQLCMKRRNVPDWDDSVKNCSVSYIKLKNNSFQNYWFAKVLYDEHK